jgi:MFS family permease
LGKAKPITVSSRRSRCRRSGRQGRAVAIVIGGITVSTVLGVPGGTFLGQFLGWRSAFWTVAVLSTVAMAGVASALPKGRGDAAEAPEMRAELRSMEWPWPHWGPWDWERRWRGGPPAVRGEVQESVENVRVRASAL